MKKNLLLLMIFLSSCSLFSAKLDTTKYDLTYTNTWNIEFQNLVNDYEKLELKNLESEFQVFKEKWEKISEKPSISMNYSEYNDKNITSVLTQISNNIKDELQKNTKVFYFSNDKESKITWNLRQNDIFVFDEAKKENFKKYFLGKIRRTPGAEIITEKLDNAFERYFSKMNFYFDNKKIIFVFDDKSFWEKIEKIEFYFYELQDYLNPEVFSDIKKEILKKQEEEKQRKLQGTKKSTWNNKNISKVSEERLALNSWKKYIALTFDDGPNPRTTPELLDILKKNDVKATFFVLGKLVATYPEVVKREYDEWREIASHTWSHPNLKTLSKSAILREINNTDEKIKEAIWKVPTLLRPPYGSHTKEIDNLSGKTIVLWDVDSLDWKYRNADKNYKTAMSQITNWSIILFHDIHKPSVDTIDRLIKTLKSQWYEFLTVTELLNIWQNWDISKKVCTWEFSCHSY